jgi:hypothetical protein
MRYLDPKHHEEIVKSIFNAAEEHMFGGYFALFHFVKRSKWSARKAVLMWISLPWFVLCLVVDVCALPLMVVNVVLNELTLNMAELPVNEANFAVGQWGPVVGGLLVFLAALVNQSTAWYLKRKKVAKQRKKEAEEMNKRAVGVGSGHQMEDIGTIELGGEVEGQTVGVVKPGIAHVTTLRNISEWMKPKR